MTSIEGYKNLFSLSRMRLVVRSLMSKQLGALQPRCCLDACGLSTQGFIFVVRVLGDYTGLAQVHPEQEPQIDSHDDQALSES
jgi:hypothetical protein